MLTCLRIKFLRTTIFAGMTTTLVGIFLSAPINDGHMSSAQFPRGRVPSLDWEDLLAQRNSVE